MPGAPAGAAESFFSGKSATMHSVVKTIPAIEAAFCNPERVTFAGSTIPAEDISTYSPVAALNPSLNGLVFTFSAITAPLEPAFSAILIRGAVREASTMLDPINSSPSKFLSAHSFRIGDK